MAQKKNSTRASKSARASAKTSEKKPRRREIPGIIFLFLGVFAFIGYFESDAIFIKWFCVVAKVLMGWGFYIVPPVLLAASAILLFHRGKPITFRLTCDLLLPVAAGGLYQLFACGKVQTVTWAIFRTLTSGGLECKSGGILGGLLAVLFERWFSKAGASAVFIVGFLFLLISACNLTPAGIIDRIRKAGEVPYEPEPEPELGEKKKKSLFRSENNRQELPEPETAKKRSRAIDVPFDDEDVHAPVSGASASAPEEPLMPSGKRKSFFHSKPAVKSPDQLIAEDAGEESGTAVVEPWNAPKSPEPWEKAPEAEVPWEEPVPEQKAGEQKKTAKKDESADERKQKQMREDLPFIPPTEEELTGGGEDYVFPSVQLLQAPETVVKPEGKEETSLNRTRLETTLRSFGINSSITNIIRGPSVTRYELELEAGVKLSKITTLSDDIALALGASGVRVAAIPNKVATVGIEVPNKVVSKVYLREIIESPEFQKASSKLTFAIGKNIAGESIVGNIAKLPHMLVAGTTGSGKSVCLNSLILSILYKAKPDEVKFILIDPKMVEFKIYNGIPHLLVPVVTEAKKASGALQWAVFEMMKRYRLFSDTGARDLATYNELVRENGEEDPLPQIVVVIDELADLMMVAAKEVEESICRIAQMGRAAGVHLVIATQSPRADVITGLMKANIPSRIAFKVSSSLESRIILDAGGSADKLVGYGDMLYAPIGSSRPARIQGTWVSDEERESVLSFLKESGEAQYSDEVIRQIERAAEDKNEKKSTSQNGSDSDELFSEYDDMLPQAVDVILDTKQASVTLLQRRLKLGYSRAARIMDQMEEIGVVGPFEGSKPRQILITKEQWQERQFLRGNAPIERLPEDDVPLDFDDMPE